MAELSFRDENITFGMSPKDFDFLSLAKFDTKECALSERAKVQESFLEYLSLEVTSFSIPYQVHATNILEISLKDTEKVKIFHPQEEADGLYSLNSNILLGVTVADCAGIVLYDKSTGFIATLHSGWRGTLGKSLRIDDNAKAKSILSKCVAKCIDEQHISCNINLDNTKVWISPCAKSCCYEVGAEFIEYTRKCPQCLDHRKNRYYLDISIFIYNELLNMGLKEQNISISPECTICNKNFYSHRRGVIESTLQHVGRSVVYVVRE